jgi:hypothetical protein
MTEHRYLLGGEGIRGEPYRRVTVKSVVAIAFGFVAVFYLYAMHCDMWRSLAHKKNIHFIWMIYG